jgi:predicted phage-related endonuclease
MGVIVAAQIDDLDDEIRDLRFRRIERDQDRIDDLVSIASVLLGHIDAGTLPPPTGSALDLVRAHTARADTTLGPLDLTELESDIARLSQLRGALGDLKDQADEMAARITLAMGEHTSARAGRWRVTYSQPENRLDEASFLVAHPEHSKRAVDRKSAPKKLLDKFTARTGPRKLTMEEAS